MTAPLAKPDPYRLKPSKPGASRRSVSIQPQSDGQRLRELVRLGFRAMTHERLEDARTNLEAAASSEYLAAGNALAIDALAYLSSVRWELGDIDGALDASERALTLAPMRFAPNQKAGEIAIRLGNPAQASERFLVALRASEPGTADAKVAEACLRDARKRLSRGIRHGASFPTRPGGLLSRLTGARRNRTARTSVTAGAQQEP